MPRVTKYGSYRSKIDDPACVGHADLFWPDVRLDEEAVGSAHSAAISICATACPIPVRQKCLAEGLRSDLTQSIQDREGVYGGMSPHARTILIRQAGEHIHRLIADLEHGNLS